MEHGADADAGTEMARVGGDGQHGLRRRAEQQVVDDGLVLGGDVGDLGRQREHDMEVADWQQVGLASYQPLSGRRALTLGAVPISAGNGNSPLPALWAKLVMGSWQANLSVFCGSRPVLLSITVLS